MSESKCNGITLCVHNGYRFPNDDLMPWTGGFSMSESELGVFTFFSNFALMLIFFFFSLVSVMAVVMLGDCLIVLE